jgi:hypothetical protein
MVPKVSEVESLSMGAPISAQAGRLVPIAINNFRFYAGLAPGANQGESWPADVGEGAYKVRSMLQLPGLKWRVGKLGRKT